MAPFYVETIRIFIYVIYWVFMAKNETYLFPSGNSRFRTATAAVSLALYAISEITTFHEVYNDNIFISNKERK